MREAANGSAGYRKAAVGLGFYERAVNDGAWESKKDHSYPPQYTIWRNIPVLFMIYCQGRGFYISGVLTTHFSGIQATFPVCLLVPPCKEKNSLGFKNNHLLASKGKKRAGIWQGFPRSVGRYLPGKHISSVDQNLMLKSSDFPPRNNWWNWNDSISLFF